MGVKQLIKNPYPKVQVERIPNLKNHAYIKGKYEGFNEGVKTAVQWMEEPCKVHGIDGGNCMLWEVRNHRYLCSLCWQELKESVKDG